VQCTRRIPQLRRAHLPARCLAGRGRAKNPTQAHHGSAIAAGVRPTRHEISRRVFATIPAGRRRAAAAYGRAPHVALGWAKWPRAARAGGRGTVPGRRPAINCQKSTALCLFKTSSESEPYPSGQKTRPSSRGKQRGILGRLSAAVADRPDGWRGRAVSPPGGTGPGSPAPPGRGHRSACWAPELAPRRD
jgi:hypothetical protein